MSKRKLKVIEGIEIHEGSGNVYADLDYPDLTRLGSRTAKGRRAPADGVVIGGRRDRHAVPGQQAADEPRDLCPLMSLTRTAAGDRAAR